MSGGDEAREPTYRDAWARVWRRSWALGLAMPFLLFPSLSELERNRWSSLAEVFSGPCALWHRGPGWVLVAGLLALGAGDLCASDLPAIMERVAYRARLHGMVDLRLVRNAGFAVQPLQLLASPRLGRTPLPMPRRRERCTVRYRIPAGALAAFKAGKWPIAEVALVIVERDGRECRSRTTARCGLGRAT